MTFDHDLRPNFQVQTIPVPVVKVNQKVMNGEEAKDIKGKVILGSEDPDICDTENNILI